MHAPSELGRGMFSYVFMKILEARPGSYDRRMDQASRGRVTAARQAVAQHVPARARVLDVGCGTGALAEILVRRGAWVEAFDLNPAMCAAARQRFSADDLSDRITIRTMGVERMDEIEAESFDAVTAILVLSELHPAERRFALAQAYRALRPEGRLIVADEVRPRSARDRALHAAFRLPALAATYLATGAATEPIEDLAGDMTVAGLSVEQEQRSHGDAFAIVVAARPPLDLPEGGKT